MEEVVLDLTHCVSVLVICDGKDVCRGWSREKGKNVLGTYIQVVLTQCVSVLVICDEKDDCNGLGREEKERPCLGVGVV